MRTLFIIPLVLMSLVSFPVWGLTMDDLVIRAGLYYEKFTATPFTGEVDEGRARGSFKDGKIEGSWKTYWGNGKLFENGNYKNGKMEGSWEYYDEDGRFRKKEIYKNGQKNGYSESYWDNGQLWFKGNYKNGGRDGYWESYDRYGNINKESTGTFRNGVKVSD